MPPLGRGGQLEVISLQGRGFANAESQGKGHDDEADTDGLAVAEDTARETGKAVYNVPGARPGRDKGNSVRRGRESPPHSRDGEIHEPQRAGTLDG